MTVLLLVHRWLGIAGGALFALWFASGIAMMYVRMPEVTAAERLARAAPIDPARVRVGLDAAARAAAAAPDAAVTLRMLGARPVYAFGAAGTTVFADDGSVLAAVTADDALALGRVFLGPGSAPLSYGELVALPDQWTLQNRAHLPLHRLRAGDVAGTDLYVSSVTGDVVMQTTGRFEGLAYLGPVPHWLYLPVLRRNGPLWSQVVVALSALGCVACLSGLAVGVWRLSAGRRYRRDGRPTITPYSGWLRWHHYAGLAFGVVTFTWTFSGMLSMDPFPQLSTGGATPAQRQAVEGADTGLGGEALDAGTVAAGVSAAAARLSPRELVLARVGGRRRPDRVRDAGSQRAGGRGPARWAGDRALSIGRDRSAGAGRGASADCRRRVAGRRRRLLPEPDAPRPLPVLRIRSGDRDGTWVYLDPRTGSIVQVLRRPDRVNRWLYHGLHSLDAAWLWHRRPLWDVTVIGLSLGGLALALTSATPGWRRVPARPRS